MTTTQAPRPILDALEAIHAAGLEIVPGSLRWVPHPTKPGREVAQVATRERETVENGPENPGELTKGNDDEQTS